MERWIDYYGNVSHYLSFERGYDHLEISGMSKVEVQPRWIPPHEQSPLVRTILEQLILNHSETGLHPLEMREASPRIDHEHEAVIQYANEIFHEERPILVCLRDLLARFAEEFKFDSTATTVNSTVEEVLVNRRGVCQDFTHLAIALCRAKRIPARYVSGYLRTHPPAGKPRRRGADASHAWVSV
ncbi:MAG: transglutaminase family protein, partial [Planctomycetaceae bacterium]|nr:transglutaminase family protein [Planctomycetaceae bacterium]